MTEEQRPALFHPSPGARISLAYGVEADYWKDYGIKDHRGVDFALPTGSQFWAAFTGTIWTAAQRSVSGVLAGAGWYMAITAWPWQALYFHLAEDCQKWRGERVEGGTWLHATGATGNCTAPHLHWEIRYLPDSKDGRKGAVDPFSFRVIEE
jgi:murein DD-endopeptidase MepM/ murein hydrolase activator NlpD